MYERLLRVRTIFPLDASNTRTVRFPSPVARRFPSTEKVTAKKSDVKKSGGTHQVEKKGLMKELQPDAELAAIVGNQPIPRTEVTKKVWDYIKGHDLQDQKNKRMINADDKLQPLFGGRQQVSMFEMTKLVNQHLK